MSTFLSADGIVNAGQICSPTDTVQLIGTFYDGYGNVANTSPTYPKISIISASGLLVLPFTSSGVYQIDVGKYGYQFQIPYSPELGNWTFIWQGSVNGIIQTQTLNFLVNLSQGPSVFVNSDGYSSLGDDVGFRYSSCAIHNINKLLKTLKMRLYNDGKARSTDSFGNILYVDCNVFSNDMLITFIANATSDFNQIPYFTFFRLDDNNFVDQFHDILVEGATTYALAAQALIEKGREFTITDNGVNFNPPLMAEMLNTQYTTVLNNYYDKLKYIKASLRPAPKGLGVLSMLSQVNPQVARLRHLRARQIL